MSHYYEKTAEGVTPRHFVPLAKGDGLRPTRITDARKAGWYPSVTTVMGLLDKPALTDWKIQEHLKQAYETGRVSNWGNFTCEEWVSKIKQQTQAALDKAPKDGTDFHDVMDTAYQGGAIENDFHREIAGTVMGDIEAHTGIVSEDFEPELSFVHTMGFAGKVDLHTGACAKGWVIDYKTKNTADKWKPGKMAYPEMAMQLAAYRVGLGLDNARCANVFICLETGEVEFYEWGDETLNRQWANFADLLRIWLRNAEYVPGSKPAGNS